MLDRRPTWMFMLFLLLPLQIKVVAGTQRTTPLVVGFLCAISDPPLWCPTVAEMLSFRIEQINNNTFDPNLLPGAQVSLLYDTVNPVPSSVVQRVYQMIASGATAIIGPGVSSVATTASIIMQGYTIPQCDGVTTLADLSNKVSYFNFLRTVQPDNHRVASLLEFVKWKSWRMIAILATNDALGTQLLDNALQQAATSNIIVLASAQISPQVNTGEIENAVITLKTCGAAIFLFLGTADVWVKTQGYLSNGGIYGPDYVWMLEVDQNQTQLASASALDGTIISTPLEQIEPYTLNFTSAWGASNITRYPYSRLPLLSDSLYTLDCLSVLLYGFNQLLQSNTSYSLANLAAGNLRGSYQFPATFSNPNISLQTSPQMLLDSNGDLMGAYQFYYSRLGSAIPFAVYYSSNNTWSNISGATLVYAGGSTVDPPDTLKTGTAMSLTSVNNINLYYCTSGTNCCSSGGCPLETQCDGDSNGILCDGCPSGMSMWGYTCSVCNSVSGGLMFLILIVGIGVSILSIILPGASSVFLQEMLFFYQLAGLILDPQAEIWKYLSLLRIQLSNLMSLSTSTSLCLFPTQTYGRVLFNFVWPATFLIELLLIYLAIRMIHKLAATNAMAEWIQRRLPTYLQPNMMRSVFMKSLITITLLIHLPVVDLSLALFDCERIGSQSYLRAHPSIQCFNSQQHIILMVIGTIVLVGCIIVFPILTAWLLWKRNHGDKLDDHDLAALVTPFKRRYYYYYVVDVMERTLLIILTVAYGSTDASVYATGVFVGLWVIAVPHGIVRPHSTVFENVTKSARLLCLMGLCQHRTSSNEYWTTGILLVLPALLVVWPIYQGCRYVSTEGVQQIRKRMNSVPKGVLTNQSPNESQSQNSSSSPSPSPSQNQSRKSVSKVEEMRLGYKTTTRLRESSVSRTTTSGSGHGIDQC
ncbi:periplasmic binding protein-like I [Polychytrium aggregatum]|uniref:periplasmic binding protein-like I n=1 Tax=Polychytrium aggregatum TaxID=110093 RepID=UPI0022FDD5FF|nr:periplasmic binding protein-like I [Polychytrium aggregatum]KAI9209543.1 periplasmic binding protein-like I [Polychytrium aggregatum]